MSSKKNKALAKLLGEDSLYFKLHDKFITNPKNPRAATMEEWEDVETKQRKNHPVAYFIFNDVYYFFSHKKRRVSDAIWWVKYRTMKKHKYHLIDTKLEPGYHDTDHVLLHGCFESLVDFIENDATLKNIKWQRDYYKKMLDEKNWEDWMHDYSASDKKKEMVRNKERFDQYTDMIRIYTWWKKEREKKWAKIDAMWAVNRANRKKHQKNYDESKLSHVFTSKRFPGDSEQIGKIVKYEASLIQEDTDNLVALMKMRGLLWH